MEYRRLPHGGEEISALGLGAACISEAGECEMIETVQLAVEQGVNYFDVASSDAALFPAYGKALSGAREKVYLQLHFGADYSSGKYGWTTALDEIKRSVDWQLKNLKTDYIDFGFIHCIDEEPDLDAVLKNGVVDYIQQLKKSGAVRRIALSSHTPRMINRVLDMGIIDMLMFSINPGYDYSHGEYAVGGVDERAGLYRRCEAEGVGISVMKPYGGGQLLGAKTSPFGSALTDYQCLQYALDKPGVLTVLPGIRNRDDVRRLLAFFDAPPEERDYSVIATFAPAEAEGKCVYCAHCHPCPAGLDIALINKYYDLAKAGDTLARGHYEKLERKAGDCVACGHCDRRCPFRVRQSERMKEISGYFGK
ncbi:MAG: aldo/keto reductase [Butyricicoccus sp.]|nr:aldo/keto reductase [Butyricicoccus sp.]